MSTVLISSVASAPPLYRPVTGWPPVRAILMTLVILALSIILGFRAYIASAVIVDPTLDVLEAPDGEADKARVHVPAAHEGNALAVQNTSEPLPKVAAFRGAVKLANTLKLPIVVMGDEAGWDSAWGDLYRPV